MQENQTKEWVEVIETPKKKKKKKQYSITVPANKKGRHIMPFLNGLRILVVPFLRLMFPFRFYGKKVEDGACVYICNHYQLFDAMYPICTTWEGVHIIAKDSVSKSWFLSRFARRIKTINAKRDGNDARVIIDSLKCLKNGEKICIFPEGTRNKSGVGMLPFKSGASVMAIKGKAPIVPMLIYKKPRLFRMNHILIGEPFELSEYYDLKLTEEQIKEADGKLYQKLMDMRAEHDVFLQNKKKKKK